MPDDPITQQQNHSQGPFWYCSCRHPNTRVWYADDHEALRAQVRRKDGWVCVCCGYATAPQWREGDRCGSCKGDNHHCCRADCVRAPNHKGDCMSSGQIASSVDG